MNNFLTVEDVNSILIDYSKVNQFYEINTGLISEFKEYTDVLYDFVKVTHTSDNDNHTFSFEIFNDLWCGGYYWTDLYGNYMSEDAVYENNVLTITTTDSAIILVLYLNNLFTEFNLERLSYKPTVTSGNMFFTETNPSVARYIKYNVEYLEDLEVNQWGGLLYYFNNGEWESIGIARIQDNNPLGDFNFAIPLELTTIHGEHKIFKIEMNNNTFYFTKTNIKHILPIDFRIDYDKFILGKINYFYIETNESLLDYITDIHLIYKNKQFPVNLGSRTKLDLSDKLDTEDVVFKVVVGENSRIKGREYTFRIPCSYRIVNNKYNLLEEVETGGSSIIELGNDFPLIYDEDIHIEHDIIIKGNYKTLDMNSNSFIIDDGVTVIFQDLKFSNGNPVFIQEKNSNLTLNNCYFVNSNATNYNGLGSVIHCNIDRNSLENGSDFETNINNCIFDNINSSTPIFHGGSLNVDGCKVKISSLSIGTFNNEIPSFLYQTDGNAILTDNIFDFNVESNILCVRNLNIGFYQALIHCGLNAVINNASWSELKQNNSLPFFDSRYNNKSHLFVKYYDAQVGYCIIASPDLGYEDKSCCHTISNMDYVFKDNIKLTNVYWHSENNLKKIELDLSWGDD